jgi:hypothetical protein
MQPITIPDVIIIIIILPSLATWIHPLRSALVYACYPGTVENHKKQYKCEFFPFMCRARLLTSKQKNMVVAGRDITAATLTFVFYFLQDFLAMHSAVMMCLREQVLSLLGPN